MESRAACAACSSSCDTSQLRLRFRESIPSAWRSRAGESGLHVAKAIQGPEGERWPEVLPNGARVAGTEPGTLGLADQGTHLVAHFRNVPAGVRVWVEAPEAERDGLVLPVGRVEVPIQDGQGEAAWEIAKSDDLVEEELAVRVAVAYEASAAGTGAITVEGRYGPWSQSAAASASASIPRFLPNGSPQPSLTVSACRTNLLFPFLSNVNGIDTDIVITNTTKSPWLDRRTSGGCTLSYYGRIGSAAVQLDEVTEPIPDGAHIFRTLSAGATAGFQGYAIAQCEFQFARGTVFYTEQRSRRLLLGYLALVMDDPLLARTGGVSEAGTK